MNYELIFEEEVSYGCAPPEVLAAMARLEKRVAQHKIDCPGEYEPTEVTAQWMSENLRSNWKLSVTAKWVVPEFSVVAKSPPRENVGKTEEIEVNHAQPEPKAASVHVSDIPLPGVRKEGRSTAVSGT